MPISPTQLVTGNLNRLRAMGVSIDIDDFGVGYGSLLYLKHFPVTGIKIDQQFVQGLGTNERDHRIVESLVKTAVDFGLSMVGEGVEHEHQREALHKLGVAQVQGWLFSAAVPASCSPTCCEPARQAATPYTFSSLIAVKSSSGAPDVARISKVTTVVIVSTGATCIERASWKVCSIVLPSAKVHRARVMRRICTKRSAFVQLSILS